MVEAEDTDVRSLEMIDAVLGRGGAGLVGGGGGGDMGGAGNEVLRSCTEAKEPERGCDLAGGGELAKLRKFGGCSSVVMYRMGAGRGGEDIERLWRDCRFRGLCGDRPGVTG